MGRCRYTLMDLFAGCGGLTRGFVDSGRFTPVFAVESERDAAHTYAINFGGVHLSQSRIEDIDRFPAVDVVIGGPPCQGFSTLNRHRVGLEKRWLWREYVRALADSGASAFVMENVPQLLGSSEYRSLRREAKRLGYEVDGRVLNAATYGVPQHRKRAFVIGVLGGEPRWPDETHGASAKPLIGLKPWQTFRDAVEGLPVKPHGVNWHRGRRPRPESLIRYRAVPKNGGNRFQMQANLERLGRGDLVLPCFRRKPTGTTDVFGRLWWNRPCVTIRTEFYKPEKGRYLHPTASRQVWCGHRFAALGAVALEGKGSSPASRGGTSKNRVDPCC